MATWADSRAWNQRRAPRNAQYPTPYEGLRASRLPQGVDLTLQPAGGAEGQALAQQWQNEGWVNPATLNENDRYAPGSVWNGALGQYVQPGTPGAAYTGNSDIAGVQGSGGTPYNPPQAQGTTGNGYGQNGVTMPTMGQPSNYTPPAYDPNSATAQNPFLNLGLNAFANTQGPYNPTWLNQFGQSLWNQANQNWNDTINPSLNNNAILAGGYGGDRAAIAKGVATDRLNQSVFNALAPAALQDYNAWQNRALQGGQAAAGVGQGLESLDLQQRLGYAGLANQQYGLDTQRQLGLGNLGLGQYSAETQRNLGLGNLNLGQYDAETRRQLGLGGLEDAQRRTDIYGSEAQSRIANPQYTNPFAAGAGGALGIAQLLSLIYGKG